MASKALHCISADYHRLRPALWHSSVKPVGCCLIAIAMIARITLWIKDLLKKILGSTLTVKWIAPSPKKKENNNYRISNCHTFFFFFSSFLQKTTDFKCYPLFLCRNKSKQMLTDPQTTLSARMFGVIFQNGDINYATLIHLVNIDI